MRKDILADTPTYKRLVKEGFEKGLEQGREAGLRQVVVDEVQERFPELAALANALAPLNRKDEYGTDDAGGSTNTAFAR